MDESPCGVTVSIPFAHDYMPVDRLGLPHFVFGQRLEPCVLPKGHEGRHEGGHAG